MLMELLQKLAEATKMALQIIWKPAVRRAILEGVLGAASAGLAAIAAYFDGATGIDPIALLVARMAIAWAERVYFQAKAGLDAEKAAATLPEGSAGRP